MLPDDVLEAVFEHLAVRDLLRAMRVCKSWNAVIRQSHLWRRLGKKHFLLADGTYADFQRMGSEFGKYLDIYARVVRAWDAIKSVEGRNGIRFTLLPGATEAALDRVEKVMGFEYPKDLRCSLRVVGGQPFVDPRTGVSPALGAVFFYENVLDYLLPINEHRDEQGLISVVGHDSEIGVAWSAVADSLTGRQFPKGTVFSMPDVPSIGDPLMFLAPSWLDYLESRAKVAASPNLKFEMHNRIPVYLQNARDDVNGSFAVTHGVRVEVAVALARGDMGWVAEQTSVSYSYCITLSMEDDAPEGVGYQLLSRSWRIRSAAPGNDSDVQGPGVIGMYPACAPGAAPFQYCSRTYVSATDGGWMEGEFDMQVLPAALAREIAADPSRWHHPHQLPNPTIVRVAVAPFDLPPVSLLY